LREFIKEQQDLATEERAKQREYDEKQLEYQKEREKKKILAEERQMEYEREREKEKLEIMKEQRDYELEKLRIEQKRMETKLKLRLNVQGDGEVQVQRKMDQKDDDDNDDVPDETDVFYNQSGTQRSARGSKMPCFEENKDDMDSFLNRFEIYAEIQGWKKVQWAVYLFALLETLIWFSTALLRHRVASLI